MVGPHTIFRFKYKINDKTKEMQRVNVSSVRGSKKGVDTMK